MPNTVTSAATPRPARILPGLTGLTRGELQRWLGRRGVTQLALWTVVVQGTLVVNTFTVGGIPAPGTRGFDTLIHLWTILIPLAAIALAQNSLIEERHQGTAAWVLSKPVSRASFVLAKILGPVVGLFIVAIAFQGFAAYAWLPGVEPASGLPFVRPEFARFVSVLGIELLILAFFVSMTVMLSTVFRHRAPVAGIGVAVWVVAWIAPPRLMKDYLYSGLVAGDPGGYDFTPLVDFLEWNQRLEPLTSVVGTAALTVAFTAIAVLTFQREQF